MEIGAPPLGDAEIKSFAAGVKARPLRDGETLYRIVDPTSNSLSTCWVTESVWKQLNADPAKARELWRGGLAVLPHWNQNGTFIKFTYRRERDGDIAVWEGTTAMQYFDSKTQNLTDGYLEGGLAQVVWHPVTREGGPDQLRGAVKDTFAPEKTRFPDMVEGNLIPGDGYGVRLKVNDPRIEGPFETGWGFKDFDDQHKLIGLPNPAKE
jgi:hypothetical protein